MLNKNATNKGFTCRNCGKTVEPAAKTARNHCPYCLWSLHVDLEVPGDRKNPCQGLMEPGALYQKHGEWIVVHRCIECDFERPNKLSEDDNFETAIDLSKNSSL
jgi:protein-arginine kinase activator protein McsA